MVGKLVLFVGEWQRSLPYIKPRQQLFILVLANMLQTITGELSRFCDNDAAKRLLEGLQTRVYEDVHEVNPAEWGAVVKQQQRFLCLDYLSALQQAHDEGLELRCVIYKLHETVIGVAAFQITHFTTSEEAYSGWFLRSVSKISELLRGKHIHNILICGNAIATGEHGFAFLDHISQAQRALIIATSMKNIALAEKRRGKPICAMVAKDFYPDSVSFANELVKARFRKFQVDHNMVMPILPEWKSFQDYLQAMNTKFRTKANAAINKSKALEVLDAGPDDILNHLERMTELYENVHTKADFRLGKFDMSTMASLARDLPNQFKVRLYFLQGKLVGFQSAMSCGDVIEAHVIGLDYSVNREYALYQRILYDYVDIAIAVRCRRIVFGRTAAEIKSTIGAFPVDLTCCVLHRRVVSNALLSLILQYIKPSEYPQREPWKAETMAKLKDIPLYD